MLYSLFRFFAMFIISSVSLLITLILTYPQQDHPYSWNKEGIVFKLTRDYAKYDIRWFTSNDKILVVVETNGVDSIAFYFIDLKRLEVIDSVKFSFNSKLIDILTAFDVEKNRDTVFVFFSQFIGTPPANISLGNSLWYLKADLKNRKYSVENLFTYDTTKRYSVWHIDAEYDNEYNNLYIFWNYSGDGFRTRYKVRKNGDWSDTSGIVYIYKVGSAQVYGWDLPLYSDLLIDNTGKFHTLGLRSGIEHGLSTDSGKTWNGQEISPGNALFERKLLVDYNGNLHAFFSVGTRNEFGGFGPPTSIQHAFSTDGGKTWSAPIDITKSLPSPKIIGLSFDAVVDSWNRVHLVFDAEIKGVGYIYHTYWNGRRWSDFQKLDFSYMGGIVQLNVDEYNNLHLVFSSKPAHGLVYAVGTPLNAPEQPKYFKIYPNFPNPFNYKTNIKFTLSKQAYVLIKIYDITGKLITTLMDSDKKPGTYQIEFNASNLSSGVYFLEFNVDGIREFKKLLLIK